MNSKSTPKISVIVPVYNSEPYIRSCVNSILTQTFRDFELLLVDDGSTDGSGAILDGYLGEKHAVAGGIKVFHKPNGGVSSARNLGIREASGEWICFVDSDDELLPEALHILAEGCPSAADIDLISAGYERYSLDGTKYSTSVCGDNTMLLDKNQSVYGMYRSPFYQFYVVAKLFRRSIIEDNALCFDETLPLSEDRVFIINYICAMSGSTYCTTHPVYRYILRQGGAMMSVADSFDYKNVRGFDATLMMVQSLDRCGTITSDVRRVAVFDVVDSYKITRSAMNKHNIRDRELVARLNRGLRSVMSRRQYIVTLCKIRIKNCLTKIPILLRLK